MVKEHNVPEMTFISACHCEPLNPSDSSAHSQTRSPYSKVQKENVQILPVLTLAELQG